MEHEGEFCNNGYVKTMQLAGAKVLAFEEFGSYQGTWFAKVNLPNKDGIWWITGDYGSCSGCDAFESEFGYYDDEEEKEPEFQIRLVRFGQEYLDQSMDFDAAMEKAKENIEWDADAESMVKWLEENK